jgi:hypothetical protein
MPGVEDMMMEYRWGVAQIRTAGEDAGVAAGVAVCCAGTMLQVPCTHPQEPAPQSSGPWQLIVHISVQTRFATLLMQPVAWQHWAGMQSASTVQPAAVIGVGATGDAVTSGMAGTGVAGACGGVPEMHPATATAIMQRIGRKRMRVFIQDHQCLYY